MKVDLCCGHNCKEGFEGLDITKYNEKVKYLIDLNKEKLPFENNSVNEFYEQNSFYELEKPIEIIQECNRCLKIGGILEFKEMYFTSHYAYTPRTKNFWNYSTKRLFTKGYRYCGDWEIENIKFETSGLTKIFDYIIENYPNIYEKYLSHTFPATSIIYRLKKVKQQ